MFCDSCGAEFNRKAGACPVCGWRPAPFQALPPAAALENLRKQWVTYCRVRLYGGLLLTLQILGWLYMIDAEMQRVNARVSTRGQPMRHAEPLNFAMGMLCFVGILGIVWATLGFMGTRALAEESAAGRRRAAILATILLLDVPFGTVLSILLLRAIARVDALPPPQQQVNSV